MKKILVIKKRAFIILSLLTIINVHLVHATEEYRVENSNNPCKNQFQLEISRIKKWIDKGGAWTLQFPKEISLRAYTNKMLKAISEVRVRCTNEVITIGLSEKTCKNVPNDKLIICNRDNFNKTTFEERIILVHHELAGLAALEKSNNERSDYSISNQLSNFIDYKAKQLIPQKIDDSFVNEIFANGLKVIYKGICHGDPSKKEGLRNLQALQNLTNIESRRNQGKEIYQNLITLSRSFDKSYEHYQYGHFAPGAQEIFETYMDLAKCLENSDSLNYLDISILSELIKVMNDDQIKNYRDTKTDLLDFIFKFKSKESPVLKKYLKKNEETVKLVKFLYAFRSGYRLNWVPIDVFHENLKKAFDAAKVVDNILYKYSQRWKAFQSIANDPVAREALFDNLLWISDVIAVDHPTYINQFASEETLDLFIDFAKFVYPRWANALVYVGGKLDKDAEGMLSHSSVEKFSILLDELDELDEFVDEMRRGTEEENLDRVFRNTRLKREEFKKHKNSKGLIKVLLALKGIL